ncbi:Uu.00g104020.m01.CDS01 [Anthostomella pinea]|uniref:Uu.00g104020.m01.CDS01 n=1 Tax=Anthostomella pinea TaxID=933095 RepID=A0AAI8VEM4_9PEZI|nr:Uu.00g104020.m01.CDS01 [Anthostomella pinea]
MSSTNDPDRGPAVFAVTTATLVLATCFVAARLACRVGIVRHISWDDYFIVTAWILAVALSFTIDLSTRKGLGRHDENIAAEDWNTLRRCEYVFSVLYNPALMAFKTSILVFYLRLSKDTQKVLRLSSWGVLAVVNVAGLVLTLINIFQCSPVQAAFNPYHSTAYCIPLLTEYICSAPINIVTDLAILALPLPVLTGMRLPLKQKVILIITFALAIFVTIVDVIRIYYLQQAITQVSPIVSKDPAATFGDSPQFAWNASLSLMWSAVEVNVGITCACIPTLKPLIIRILPAMLIDPDGTRRGSDTVDKPPTSQLSDGPQSSDNGQDIHTITQREPTRPGPAHAADDDIDAQIAAMEFLTTPADMAGSGLRRTRTALTTVTTNSNGVEASGVYFGFVNMRKPKSMIRTSTRDSFKYCTLVTILFVLWGFSYGLLNTLSNVVATISGMTVPQTLGLTSIYFGAGYFFGPLLFGEWILRHDEHGRLGKREKAKHAEDKIGGFKATFIIGLCIYAVGTIMFWPSAVLTSFAGFMICNFVVGFGLAVLETAANPFLALCGPLDYAEMRLLLAQGIQAVSSVVSGLLAQKVFFVDLSAHGSDTSMTLIDVQWTYLAITLSCVALALFFYYMPLPEVTDAELENSTRYLPVDPKKRSFGGLQLRTWTLALAVLAQWTYVASQESMSIFFGAILTSVARVSTSIMTRDNTRTTDHATEDLVDHPDGLAMSISDYLLIAHSAFAISRFLAAYIAYLSPSHPKVPQPHTILTICTGCSIACGVVLAALRTSNSNFLAIPAILFFFFEGPIWPLIFALGLRGQGRRTKRAAAYITMGASGPAFWPFVMYEINQKGGSYQTAFIVVPALLVITGLFSLFLDFKRNARMLVDARVGAEQQSRIQDRANREMDLDDIIAARRRASLSGQSDHHERGSFVKRFSVALGKGRNSPERVTNEHRESKRSGSG